MMRLAEAVARKSHASALVTGESLGQVASQTIKALGVTEDVTTMPVLRRSCSMAWCALRKRLRKSCVKSPVFFVQGTFFLEESRVQ